MRGLAIRNPNPNRGFVTPTPPDHSKNELHREPGAEIDRRKARLAWLKALPNRLTFLRIAAIPLLLVLYPLQFRPVDILCGLIFMVAAFTDFLDGYLARKYQAVTPLGKLLDPIADKMLVAATLVLLAAVGTVPAFLAGLMICRDIGVSGLRLVALQEHLHIEVSDYGKWKTATQGVAILCLLLGRPIPGVEPLFGLPLFQIGMVALWIALILSFISAWMYGKSFVKKVKNTPHKL